MFITIKLVMLGSLVVYCLHHICHIVTEEPSVCVSLSFQGHNNVSQHQTYKSIILKRRISYSQAHLTTAGECVCYTLFTS